MMNIGFITMSKCTKYGNPKPKRKLTRRWNESILPSNRPWHLCHNRRLNSATDLHRNTLHTDVKAEGRNHSQPVNQTNQSFTDAFYWISSVNRQPTYNNGLSGELPHFHSQFSNFP